MSLAALKTELEQTVKAGKLEIKPELLPPQNLKFFWRGLPHAQLSVSAPQITLDDGGRTLTVQGDTNEKWFVRGIETGPFALSRVELRFAEAANAITGELRVDGKLKIGNEELDLSGSLTSAQVFEFRPRQGTGLSLPLAVVGDFISGNNLSAYLPAEIPLFQTNVAVSQLILSFGFERAAETTFTFTSDLATRWTLLENLPSTSFPNIALERVGITLISRYGYAFGAGFRRTFRGDIHASLTLGTPFDVALAIQGADFWELRIKPKQGNVLPALGTLAELVGGPGFKTTVEEGLRTAGLDSFAIDDVRLGIDLAAKRMRGATIRGHIVIHEVTFNLQVNLPAFQFFGALSPKTPIHLGTFLSKFFPAPESFPCIDITEFSLTIVPGEKRFEFNGTIRSSFSVQLGSVALEFREFRLNVIQEKAGTYGSLNGAVALAGVEFDFIAEYLPGGSGWQFEGHTVEGQKLPIGQFVTKLASIFSVDTDIPAPIAKSTLQNIRVAFDSGGDAKGSKNRNFSFSATTTFPVGDQELDLTIAIDLEYSGSGYRKTFAGQLKFGSADFDLLFATEPGANHFLAAYHHDEKQKPLTLKELVGAVSSAIGDAIPPSLTLDIKTVVFGLASEKKPEPDKGTKTTFLFGVDIGTGLNLSDLPLVGQTFPRDQTISIDDLQLYICNEAFKKERLTKFNQLLRVPRAQPLPFKLTQLPERDLDKGFNVTAQMHFGSSAQTLALPTAAEQPKPADGASGAGAQAGPASPQTQDTAKWFAVQKSLGPVYFERIGLQYRDAEVWFLLDAVLRGAGLTLSLDGLAVHSPIKKFDPQFALQGLGMAFKRGDLEIGGALLQRPAPAKDAYDGALILRYKRIAIEAVGSYETVDDRPALFIYALIDYPLGGPAFFFVEGGALGFGYNRSFTMPTIEQVAEFPLVKQALSPSESKLTPMQLAGQLRPYVKPAGGEYFIAAGVKFTSFKTIKGFVLLTILFGKHFEIDVLGKATLTSPSGVDSSKALMSATLLFLGRFLPEEGLLMVMAQLAPDAHLFAPDCHLSGGFALYCWFGGEHKGDFVLTLGGYHKSFLVPDHYPKVPRLAMNWQVNPNLSLKAEAYFALTPSALMAGGKLEINWQSGDLQAWFRAEIDFLIGWQPFYYDGHAYVAIGARYRFEFFGKHEISAELTAQLDLWGPPFSGRARVQWNLLAFEVAFGDKEPHPPEALKWPAFRKAFLPEGRMFTVTAEAGKVAQGAADAQTDGNLGCLNQRNLCIAVRSPLPIKEPKKDDPRNDLLKNALESPGRTSVTGPKLGIAPMNKTADEWKESLVTITIFRRKDANTKEDVSSQFQATRIRNNVPASLWGETMDPKKRKKDDPQLLADAICGYEIRLSSPVKDPKLEAFTLTPTARKGDLSTPAPARLIKRESSSNVANDIAASLLNVEVRKRRSEIVNDLLPQVDVDWTSVTIASWRGTPSIVKPRA